MPDIQQTGAATRDQPDELRGVPDGRSRDMRAAEAPDLQTQKDYWKYWNTRSEYPHDRALRRGEKMLALLRSLKLERPVCLDLGCGMGWFASQLAQFGPTTGIDLSEEAIQLARSKYPGVDFQAGDALELSLPTEHYDVVVSQEVIAHVPDQPGYLELAAGALKPGGYLILTTPNRFVHDRIQWPAQPPGHIEKWLHRRELMQLLAPHFRIVRTTTAVPMGERGVLRIVNSVKVNKALNLLLTEGQIESLKEWAGFGWTRIVLARRKA